MASLVPNVARHSIPQWDFNTMKMHINLNLNVKFVTGPFLTKLDYDDTNDNSTEVA
ncbi:hypothetical protein LOAG_13530, partial [Loa loa]